MRRQLIANRHLIALVALFLVLCVAWYGTIAQLSSLIWKADIYSHGVWVPVVTLWLISRSWENLRNCRFYFWWPAIVGFVVMNGLWLIGGAIEASIIQHFALVGAIQCIVAGSLGGRAYRTILYPMLFLFLAIPLGQQLVEPLQALTAKLVIWTLDISGIEFEADGVLIKLSSGYYQVARACAGVKFLNSSLVMGILLCHLAFSSWKRRILMMVAAVLVPIIFNAVRVYGTLLIAEMTDASFAKGLDHIVYGWGFLSFILILLVAGAYRFSDKDDGQDDEAPTEVGARSYRGGWGLAVLVVGILPVATATWLQTSRLQAPVCTLSAFEVPDCDGCSFRNLSPEVATNWIHPAGADQVQSWFYRDNADTVMGQTALYWPDRLGHRMVGTVFRKLNEGWDVLEGQETQPISIEGLPFEERVIWREEERRLLWRSYFVGGAFYASGLQAKLALANMRIKGEPAIGQSIVIATDLTSTKEEARAILYRFFKSFPPKVLLWMPGEGSWDGSLCAA